MLDGFGTYRPRRTPLHLLPTAVKASALAASAVGIFLIRGPEATLVLFATSLGILLSTRPPLGPTLQGLRPIVILAGLVGAYQWFRGDRTSAGEIASDFLSIAFLALAFTTSTRLDDAVNLIGRLARPLRRRISPESVGLVFGLTARAIPEVTGLLSESRDAARARGLSRKPAAIFTPAAVRVFGWALSVGDAVTARGLVDGEEPLVETGPRPGTPD